MSNSTQLAPLSVSILANLIRNRFNTAYETLIDGDAAQDAVNAVLDPEAGGNENGSQRHPTELTTYFNEAVEQFQQDMQTEIQSVAQSAVAGFASALQQGAPRTIEVEMDEPDFDVGAWEQEEDEEEETTFHVDLNASTITFRATITVAGTADPYVVEKEYEVSDLPSAQQYLQDDEEDEDEE